jgi:hypothetical protein
VWSSLLFGGVVPRGKRPVGSGDYHIPHGSNGRWPSVGHGGPAPVPLAGLGRGEGL